MYRIGVDLGGTNIAVGIVNENYEIIGRGNLPTGAGRPYEEMVADICKAAELALEDAGIKASECESIGVGAPGTCNSETGIVTHAYNLGWTNVPLCRMLTEHFGIPAQISNDANVAALAEVAAGAAKGYKDAVLVTLGTGVGAGIIIDGKIYAGMKSAGAEIGHTTLILGGEPCTCGRRGCFEAYGSVTALIRQAKAAAAVNKNSKLAELSEFTGRTIFAAADQGDAAAQEVIDQWLEYIAAGLANIVNALAPEIIIIGGGISAQGERLLQPFRDYIPNNIFGGADGAVPIVAAATLGNDAGIIGAALL